MSKTMVPIAIIHHANQFLITNGYENRTGIAEIVGPSDASGGLRAILELHSIYDIPLHLHMSGIFLEACAWFEPRFLQEITELQKSGLIEILGSAYAQNIMPLFDQEHNYYQVQEELQLIRKQLLIQPSKVSGFWVPERVWNTELLANVLVDPSLENNGFRYILVDDRLFLGKAERDSFDETYRFIPRLFEAHEMEGGKGLIALPISTEMRLNIPLESKQNEHQLNLLLSQLHHERKKGRDVIAIYADDMEKASGIPPWNPRAIEHYHRFLQWLTNREDAKPVLLSPWIKQHHIHPQHPIGPGTYKELAISFGAGENYSGWAGSPAWTPYQRILNQAWQDLKSMSGPPRHESALLDLARKHILVCTYETGWHDSPNSVHANQSGMAERDPIIGSPAPWARAVASHVRAAYVMMKAMKWAPVNNKEILCHQIKDLDYDGHEEIVLRNELLAVVVTPHFGGRVNYVFSFKENDGVLVVGNPSDDWNWLEELNDFMNVPMNHPGALADYGFEHDHYEVVSLKKEMDQVEVILANKQLGSPAYGMIKRYTIRKGESRLNIHYEQIPSEILPLSLDIGYSPDYLRLLREGRNAIAPYDDGDKRGFHNGSIFAWAQPLTTDVKWEIPRCALFGHGCCVAFTIHSTAGSLCLGVDVKKK